VCNISPVHGPFLVDHLNEALQPKISVGSIPLRPRWLQDALPIPEGTFDAAHDKALIANLRLPRPSGRRSL